MPTCVFFFWIPCIYPFLSFGKVETVLLYTFFPYCGDVNVRPIKKCLPVTPCLLLFRVNKEKWTHIRAYRFDCLMSTGIAVLLEAGMQLCIQPPDCYQLFVVMRFLLHTLEAPVFSRPHLHDRRKTTERQPAGSNFRVKISLPVVTSGRAPDRLAQHSAPELGNNSGP